MSIAGRFGKLVVGEGGERWHRIEDLLTSDVFSAYRYLPTHVGVLPFLMQAKSARGEALGDWLASRGFAKTSLIDSHIEFWPTLAGKEPDALVLLGDGKSHNVAVLVEAKLHASQHMIDERSQLGHYSVTFRDGLFEDLDDLRTMPHLRPVVYVTRSPDRPDAELLRAEKELAAVIGNDLCADVGIFWVSWRTAHALALEAWEEHAARIAAEPWWNILHDLAKDLEARGIRRPSATSFTLPKLEPLPHVGGFARWKRSPRREFRDLMNLSMDDCASTLAGWRMR